MSCRASVQISLIKWSNKGDFLKVINLYYSEEEQRYQIFIPGLDSNKDSLSKAILAEKQDDVQIQKLFGSEDQSTTGSQYVELV